MDNDYTPMIKIEYNRNNIVHFFKEYNEAFTESEEYRQELYKLRSADLLSRDSTFDEIKNNITNWLDDMSKAGLINKKDSINVNNILTNAYEKAHSAEGYDKLKELTDVASQKLKALEYSFVNTEDNNGYLTNVLQLQIFSLVPLEAKVISNILEKDGIHISNVYMYNLGNDGNFDLRIYADNREVLSDIQDEINMASLKHDFRNHVKTSNILSKEDTFKLMTNMKDLTKINNTVMLGSHINKIVTPSDLKPAKQKEESKLKFG